MWQICVPHFARQAHRENEVYSNLRTAEALALSALNPRLIDPEWLVDILSSPNEVERCVEYYKGTILVMREALDRLVVEPMPTKSHGLGGGFKPWWGQEDFDVVWAATEWLIETGSPRMQELHQVLTVPVQELLRLRDALQLDEEAAQYKLCFVSGLLRAVTGAPVDRMAEPRIAWMLIVAATLDIWDHS